MTIRKKGLKAIATLVSSTMLFSIVGLFPLSSSAICCRKDGFDKSRYKLTGIMSEDVATIAKSQKGRTCNEFGYSGVDYGAWCDEFVADCIENAGADDSIVAHGGTVADFESKMRKRGAYEVSTPQAGDLLFFTWSHVEIVTKYENGVVYSAGGNNGDRPGYCRGEHTVSKGNIRLFLRPRYINIPPPITKAPEWALVSIDKPSYKPGENVTFQLSSDTGTSYTVGIDSENADGTRTRIDTYDTSDISYTRTFDTPGKYSCYITTYNEHGLADSSRIFFTIYDTKPGYAKVSLGQSAFRVGENATFHLSSDTGTVYTVGIDVENNDGTRNRIDTYDTSDSYYTKVFDSPGNYSCYITSYNEIGLADSERIFFSVYDSKPGYAKVELNQNAYKTGENISFRLSSDTGNSYTIGIDSELSDGTRKRIETYNTDLLEKIYTTKFDTPGQYSCYITTYNDFGLADSERIYFSVYDSKPGFAKVKLNQNAYKVGENVIFNLSSDTGNSYTVGIDSELSDGTRNRVDTYDTKLLENTYTKVFDTPGQYSCYITTYNDLGFADSERIYFSIYDSKPRFAKVETDKSIYNIGEKVQFVLSSDTGNSYTVGIDSELGDGTRKRIYTYDTKPLESTYTKIFDMPGQYSCYITTYNDLGLADSERIYFTISSGIKGDSNNDGEVTVADAVMLQKWLLGSSKELTCWQNVDLCEDGVIDTFDMVMLRRLLIEKTK